MSNAHQREKAARETRDLVTREIAKNGGRVGEADRKVGEALRENDAQKRDSRGKK